MTYRNITCIQNKIEVLQQIALRQKKKKEKVKIKRKHRSFIGTRLNRIIFRDVKLTLPKVISLWKSKSVFNSAKAQNYNRKTDQITGSSPSFN